MDTPELQVAGPVATITLRRPDQANRLTPDDLAALAGALHDMGVRNYALQLFRPQGCRNRPLKAAALAGYPGKDLLQRLDALFPNFKVRQG